MRNIEAKISPLVKSMFPSFYLEEGPNFIAFMEAYYEWLEQNFQLIDLEDTTGFVVGATINQEEVTGTIVAFIDNSILVLVDGLNTFKCVNVCSEMIPVTTLNHDDGAFYTTYIQRGGTTRRLGTLFMSRNLLNLRDLDTTMDLFIVKFKEKYLKNIEFDTATNKKLLIKNSLDLYRSKGTSRSIDLFFRLIYGINTEVYFPGDDLFKLSGAEWVKPQYIEINSTSVTRAISLVGKQIKGAISGATAFVERYVKQKVNNTFIHVLYLSNVQGTFTLNEILYNKLIYSDSPVVFGSLSTISIKTGSYDFKVGDLVDIVSDTGRNAVGRVSEITSSTGEVSFDILESGFGYTISDNTKTIPAQDATQSYVSNTNMTLENLIPGKIVNKLTLGPDRGSGYSNGDIVVINSRYDSARGKLITNSSGSAVSIVLTYEGAGFELDDLYEINISVLNPAMTAPSSGINVNINYELGYRNSYTTYLSGISQKIYQADFLYFDEYEESQLAAGSFVEIGDMNYGLVTQKTASTETENGKITVVMYNKGQIENNNIITLVSNTQVSGSVFAISDVSASADIIYVSNTATLKVGAPTGVFTVGDFIYQVDQDNNYIATATITKTSELSLTGGRIRVKNFAGVFRPQENIYVDGKDRDSTYAEFKSIDFDIGITNRQGNFTDSYTPELYSDSGFKANVSVVFGGSNASFKVGTLNNAEEVLINTDIIANGPLNVKLNALAYGFENNPLANSQSIIFDALTFETLTIGSIATLTEVNPGMNYTADPYVSVYQPYVAGYNMKDLIFTINNAVGSFYVGENVTQTVTVPKTGFFVDDSSSFRLGELLHVSNTSASFVANGVIDYVNNEDDYIILKNVVGTVPNNISSYKLKSLISSSSSNIISKEDADVDFELKAQVKAINSNTVFAKRIQFEDFYDTNLQIIGSLTGATANIVSIDTDTSSSIVGLNGNVFGDAITANGTVLGLQVISSGYGFNDNQELIYYSNDGNRSGTARGHNKGLGIGLGFYNDKKGFLSDTSKIHDGDYYQEYSYDILSKFPLDKYGDMFKKVMHTAGTRVFGSVVVDSVLDLKVTRASANSLATKDETLNDGIINGSVVISNVSPYVIQDRQSIDVQDRFTSFIETRE